MSKTITAISFSIILAISLGSLAEGFLTNPNLIDPNDRSKGQRVYTRENSAKPVDQGGYYGGHDTLTAEGILLKEEVHKQTDVDGGARFIEEFSSRALPRLRSGAHDEDQTRIGPIPFVGYDTPLGPNGDGNYRDHFYNPDNGRGYSLDPGSNSAVRRAIDYNTEIRKKVGCSPSGIGGLSTTDKQKVYDWFGRTLHLLQDMAHPSHTNDSLHIDIPFEDYVNNHWDEIANSKEFQEKVTAEQYIQKNFSAFPVITNFMDDLAKISKNYPTERQLYDFVLNPDGTTFSKELNQERLMKNVKDLIPEAIKYTAGYIDATYNYLSDPLKYSVDCDRPPEVPSPAGDHPDDRFDVSDEFYWEKEFKLTNADLTDLYLRTAIKKGKISIWYKEEFTEAFVVGRANYNNAPQAEKDAILANFEAIKGKLEQRRNEIESDWKGAPDIALFANGFYNPSISLMLKIKEPVSFQDVDFNPDMVKDHPVMLIPTGGFHGLSKSASVKVLLDEYVKNGGTLVAFTQQYGSDWDLLPTLEDAQTGLKKPVSGFGYQEDQSCQFNSVYVDNYHPILSGFSTPTANIGVDGYFTSYPDNSTILLRRTANGQPAIILYPYGKGYVIAATLYTDFALSHSQANQAEINLVQNIISWAKKPEILHEVKSGEIVSVPVSVTNYMDTNASAVKFTVLNPFRAVLNDSTHTISIAAGQTISIPFSYPLAPNAVLGIYHIDYTLLDGQGNIIQPQAETDSGRFVVSNPPASSYQPAKTFQIWATSPTEHVLKGTPVTFAINVKNNTSADLVNGQIGIGAHEQGSEGGRFWIYRETLKGINVKKGEQIEIPWTFQINISQSVYFGLFKDGDNTNTFLEGGGLARVEKGIRVLYPSASVSVSIDKAIYGRGQTIAANISLKNKISSSWEAELMTTITDPHYTKIFEERKILALPSDGSGSTGTSFTLPTNSSPGTYTISTYLMDGGKIISSSYARFDVLQSQIAVTPNIPPGLVVGTNVVPFTITNTGKVDVNSGVLNASLQGPDGSIISDGSQPFSIGIGQTLTLNVPLNIPSLKFGAYTLTYAQFDESREGKPAPVSLSNNATIMITFDKSSYRIRETANLSLELQNAGNFNFENVPLSLSVPDAGYTNTQTVSLSPAQKTQLSFSIPIPDTITSGQHSVDITLAFSSGADFQKSANLTVSESALSIGFSGITTIAAGDTIKLTIENGGGVDTTYETERLSITDMKGVIIYRADVTGSVLAGEKKPFSEIQVPSQTLNGPAFLNIVLRDTKNGQMAYLSKELGIAGISALLESRTDKEAYLKAEAITGLSNILNGPYGLSGGSLKIAVGKDDPSTGRLLHFLPKEGWAGLIRPDGIAVGPDGSFYVTADDVIYRFSGNGNFIKKWGTPGSGDGQFKYLSGVAVGPDGSVYSLETGNYRVQKFDGNGNFVSKWGSYGSGNGQFDTPHGITVGPDGSVYIADTRNRRIQKFDSVGTFIGKWGSYGSGGGQFQGPWGVSIGSDGSVYVLDAWSGDSVQKFDSNGNFILKWGSSGTGDGQFYGPTGIAVGPNGFVYVLEVENQRIQQFDTNGNFIRKWGRDGTGDGEFSIPESLAVAPDGTVYVADTWNDRVQRFDSSCKFIGKWINWGNGNGEFNDPRGIAVGLDSSIYVLDEGNTRVQKFSGGGEFVTEWGRYGTEDGEFLSLNGIAIGSDGSVYVLDEERVQKFDQDGRFITKFGTNGSEDGEFSVPAGISLGPDDSVYVVDHRIQKFDNRGNFITKWGDIIRGSGELTFRPSIGVGPDGSVYLINGYQSPVERYDGNGNLIARWDSLGPKWFAYIAVGSDGSVYLTENQTDSIQKFDSNGNFIAQWGSDTCDGSDGPDCYGGIAVRGDGSIYVSESSNNRILRVTAALFEATVPIEQAAGTGKDVTTGIGTLNTTGKLYLQTTLTNSLGQTIAEDRYPFYIYEGNMVLSFSTDKRYYRPGETVTITGLVENRASIDAVGLVFSLSEKQGIQIVQFLDTGTFSIPAEGMRSFSVSATAGAEGPFTLTGKVTQNGSDMVEIIDRYEVAKPAISVSVAAPDVVGSEAFNINLQVKNEGKAEATVNLQSSLDGQTQNITLAAGETKAIQYQQQVSQETIYTFSFTGDLEQTLTKKVSYGLSASVSMNVPAISPEGSVAVPVSLTNAGLLAGTIGIIFKVFSSSSSSSPIQENRKSYYLPAGGSITDTFYFSLAEGDYQLVATSQAPPVNAQASFSVRKANKVEMAILAGTQEGGLIPVTVNLSNLGFNDLSGSINFSMGDQNKVVWNSTQPLAQLAKENSQFLTFNIDPSAIPPGDYALTVEFLNNGGQQLGWLGSPLSLKGPAFQITQEPTYQILNPGQEATFTFKVKNVGNQEGSLEFHFKSYDRIDITRQEWLRAGEEKAMDFTFALPEDLEEKDYFADYEIKGGAKGQIKYRLAGINLTVSSSLDKPFYNEGDSAHLTLSVSTSNSSSQSLSARVNYADYESSQPFQLNGSQTISFDIPLAKITGEKLFFGIYQESGRSIHLNSLYIYKAGDVITLKTDKQVYKPGESVLVTVGSQQAGSGALTLSAPSYEETFAFSGNAQKTFILPAMMTAGTYSISYQLSGAQSVSGSQPFDVDGIQVKVKKATLDKPKYASSDTMKLDLSIESNRDLPATLKTWVVDPEKNYNSAGTQGITLTSAQPMLAAQSSPFSTTKLGIHRMVYGIYNGDMLLCSGSYAFDVGEAVLLGILTDRADYPQGNETIAVEASLYGTVPGNLEFSLDGQSVGNVQVSPSGFSTIQYTPPAASPGLHSLKASLTSGGLTSTKQITFAYGSNLPDLSARMTSDPNIKDGFMTITIAVTNQGKSASTPTSLGLFDGDQLLATLDVKSLQPGESQIFAYKMNVLGRAGANSLASRIDPANKVYEFSKANNEASISFTVPDLNLAVSLDKNVYGPGETAVITSSMYNLSKDPLSDLTLVTEIKDNQGVQVFNKTQILPILERQGSAMIQTLWLTDAALKEGVYSVSQTVQGKMTTRVTVSVEIKDFAKGLEGTITAQPNPVNQGSEETFGYTVMNKGSIDLGGLSVKALVINPATGDVKKTYEKVVDLVQNGTISGNFSASTAGLEPRVYNVMLQVSSAVILTPKTLGITSFEVKASVPMISWAKTYGGDHNGVAYSIQQALDEGYIIAGATGTLLPIIRDAWVWKLDGKGDIQWQKAYGSGLGDAAYAVQPTTDGGYVVAGETNGILGIIGECWVFKLDFNGGIQWQKTYGGGWARSIQQTSEGGYVVAGGREEHAWLMKLDAKGAIQWQKAYGSHGDGVYSVQQTEDGGYVVAGVTGSERFSAAWVGKLDAQGEIQWQKAYGGEHGETAYSIQQTMDGGYIIAGVTNSSEKGDQDAWIWKVDAQGEIQWQKGYGGQHGEGAYSIHQAADDGYILAGVTNSFGNGDYDAWVLKLDASGEVQWQKTYGAQHGDVALAIQQAKDGGYIVAGGTNSFGDRDYDVWLWKLDEKGEIPTCQEGWRKSTDVTARATTAALKESRMTTSRTYVLPKESHAGVRQMQGRANDVCAGIPHISLDPSSRFLTFFGVKVGRSSTTTITVFNRGTGDLKINPIKVSGGPFSQKNDCAILSPGHSCAIAVTFKPTAPGPVNATLEIYSNDPDENVVRFNLLGTGR